MLADLAGLDLGRTFDVVVLAGNVLPFVDPAARAAAVAGCARHLGADGRLVTGAGLRAGWPSVDDVDGWAMAAGLELEERFAGWGREPWTAASDYAVAIHRRRSVAPVTPRRPDGGACCGGSLNTAPTQRVSIRSPRACSYGQAGLRRRLGRRDGTGLAGQDAAETVGEHEAVRGDGVAG